MKSSHHKTLNPPAGPTVILDGTSIPVDRCAEQTVSVKGESIDAWYSGKGYQATTTQVCGLYPVVAGSGTIGAPIGRHQLSGEVVCLDPSPAAAHAVRQGRTEGRDQTAQATPIKVQASARRERPAVAERAASPHGEVYREAERFFGEQLGRGWALPYLRTRGIDAATARTWRIRYAPSGRTGLVAHLRDRGYQDAAIEASGLARRRGSRLVDAFQDRIVLTLRTGKGDITGFTSRVRSTPSRSPWPGAGGTRVWRPAGRP